jgi:hypothetical protein
MPLVVTGESIAIPLFQSALLDLASYAYSTAGLPLARAAGSALCRAAHRSPQTLDDLKKVPGVDPAKVDAKKTG